MKIIGMSVFDDYDSKLDELLKDATYSEISNYIKLLPQPFDNLESYGMSYINQFYKMANNFFEKRNQETNIEEQIKLDNKLNVIYFAYCYTNYSDITLSLREFITFSRMFCFWFDDYNPAYKRDEDNSFHTEEKWIENIVNSVVYRVNHSPHPHAFEIDETRLELLRDKLNKRAFVALEEFFYKHHIIEYESLLDEAVITHQKKQSLMKYLKERKEEK